MAEDSHTVTLYVYDLSRGVARQLSTTLFGTAIEGVWHTSVIVYGLEYFYSGGIVKSPPGQTPYGRPVRVIELGTTEVPKEVFEDFLSEISPRYTAQAYSLLKHNCNNFSNEVTQFLLGVDIPDYILRLPQDALASPMVSLLLPMIERMETTLRYGGVPQMPQAAAALPTPVLATALSNSMAERSPQQTSPAGTSSSSPPPVAEAVKSAQQTKNKMDDARARVQEEITREFAALMASGGLRASEAAALAARRVMQRHGIGGGAAPAQS